MPTATGTIYPDPDNPGDFVTVVTSGTDAPVVTPAAVSELAAEEQAWVDMETAVGYDPRDTPTGPENTSQTN
jgi:hypothetical protein